MDIRKIKYSQEKNELLIKAGRASFEDLIEAIDNGKLLADRKHVSERYSNQRILFVVFDEYVYVIPYIIDIEGFMFLKTAYPSRKFTKKYLVK